MELVVLLVVAIVIGVVGIRVGMLVAPRFERWGASDDSVDEDDRPA